MLEQRVDRRVTRSRELIFDAFMKLLMERGFESMTVQHVLDSANIGRATFYAHFKNKEDLLASSIRRLQSGLKSVRRRDVPLSFAPAFLHHVGSHRRIYDLTVGRASEITIDRHMRSMLAELVREDLLQRTRARRGSKGLEVTVQFLTGALYSLTIWWISSRARLTADELSAQFESLARASVDRFVAESG